MVSVPCQCWMEVRSLPWVGGLLRQKLFFDAFSCSTLLHVTGFCGPCCPYPFPRAWEKEQPQKNCCHQAALSQGEPVPG